MKPLAKLASRIKKSKSMVCVGLDSEFDKLPDKFKTSQTPQFDFNKWIIDQTHEFVCAYKPNTAFYEARGEQGWRELRLTMEYLQKNYPDIFTICDAKRADIDNTNKGYVKAIFDDLGFDSITLHPYLGSHALKPFLDRKDKVSIILCRTSNIGSGEFQDLPFGDEPLWYHVAKEVSQKWNTHKNCMLVVGATYPTELKAIREIVGDMPFLVPGIGAQGGDLEQVLGMGLDSKGNGLVISSSRSIIFADNPGKAAKELRDEILKIRNKK